MKYTASLTVYSSRPDMYGNSYHAFRFIDHQSGTEVHATIHGGEMNIYGVLHYWNTPDDWDRSVLYNHETLPIRQFNALVKSWPYAGCVSKELADYIRDQLAKGA